VTRLLDHNGLSFFYLLDNKVDSNNITVLIKTIDSCSAFVCFQAVQIVLDAISILVASPERICNDMHALISVASPEEKDALSVEANRLDTAPSTAFLTPKFCKRSFHDQPMRSSSNPFLLSHNLSLGSNPRLAQLVLGT